MNFKFKEFNSFEKRKAGCEIIMIQHPNKIPIVCERAPNSRLHIIKKKRILASETMTLAEFSFN